MEHDCNQKSEGKKKIRRTLKFLFTLTWAISLIVNLLSSVYQSIYIKNQRLKKVSPKHIWYRFFLFVTCSVMSDSSWPPQTVACQAPLSMGFSRQECWSGLPFPSSGDLPNPGIQPGSPTLQADSLPSEPPGKLQYICLTRQSKLKSQVHCRLIFHLVFTYMLTGWW